MAGPTDRLSAGVWQVSGESTPSAPLPEQFVSGPRPASPIAGNYQYASEPAGDIRRAPIVNRREDTSGMRYLYADGAIIQPDIAATARRGVNVNMSAFNRINHGPIHNAGFDDKHFRAGYPGFNLGLSFKVQPLPTQTTGPGSNMRMQMNVRVNNNVTNRFRRPSGRPQERDTT